MAAKPHCETVGRVLLAFMKQSLFRGKEQFLRLRSRSQQEQEKEQRFRWPRRTTVLSVPLLNIPSLKLTPPWASTQEDQLTEAEVVAVVAEDTLPLAAEVTPPPPLLPIEDPPVGGRLAAFSQH